VPPEPTPHSELIVRLLSQLGASQSRADESVSTIVSAQRELVKTLMDKEGMSYSSVSTHAEVLRFSLHSADIRRRFPELIFPPWESKQSLGLTTQDAIALYDDTITEALKLPNIDVKQREELCKLLKNRPEASVYLHFWMLNGLDDYHAFWIAAEKIIVINKKPAFRQKIWVASCARKTQTTMTEANAAAQGIKSLKVEGLSVSFYDVAGDGIKNSHNQKRNAFKKFNKNVNKAGGPDTAEKSATGRFHRDLDPGEQIHDWLLDALQRATTAACDSEAMTLYPNTIRMYAKRGKGPDFKRDIGKSEFFAPILVRNDHWVLLHRKGNQIDIYDSLPKHTQNLAVQFAHDLIANIPLLKNATVKKALWPQQSPGSNDCALFVLRGIAKCSLQLTTTEPVMSIFSRADIDKFFPKVKPGKELDQRHHVIVSAVSKHLSHLRGLNSSVVMPPFTPSSPLSQQTKQLSATVVNQNFADSVVTGSPVSPLKAHTPNVAPDDSQRQTRGLTNSNTSADLTDDPPAKSGNNLPVQCSFPKCDRTLSAGTGALCPTCQRRFCHNHVNRHSRSGWRCPACRQDEKERLVPRPPSQQRVDEAEPSFLMGTTPLNAPQPEVVRNVDFRIGQASPHLASSTGRTLRTIVVPLSTLVHPLALKGITADTRREHLRLLRALFSAPEEMLDWPIGRAALEILEAMRLKERWRWVTMENKSGSIAAALRRLPHYTGGQRSPVILNNDQEWRDAMRHIGVLAKASTKTGLPAIKEAQLHQALEAATDPEVRAVLLIQWACAARVGDVTQLKRAEISFNPPASNGAVPMKVMFTKGKVIGRIDPYTIHTSIPQKWADWLAQWVSSSETPFLFQKTSKSLRYKLHQAALETLRRVAPACDLRSVRRGAAQTLAAKGVPMETILLFTRHTDVKMLRRYLRFGQTPSEESRKATAAAESLWHISC